MKMFMVKSFLFVACMFLCVLIGMQQANEGIHRMKGYDDPNIGSAFTLHEGEQGKLHASILGKDVSSHDLEKKKEKLEEMNAYNFFSSIGKKVSDGFTSATNGIIDLMTDVIAK